MQVCFSARLGEDLALQITPEVNMTACCTYPTPTLTTTLSNGCSTTMPISSYENQVINATTLSGTGYKTYINGIPSTTGNFITFGYYSAGRLNAANSNCQNGTWNTTTPYTIKWNNGDCNQTYWITGGNGTATTSNDYWLEVVVQQKSPEARLREILRSRMSPAFIHNNQNGGLHPSRAPVLPTTDIREMRARETLRLIVGEEKYLNFLKDGFVSVRGKSGLDYQVFPSHGITRVYKQGRMIERLCIYLQGNFPPSDSVIMRFLLILNNEDMFWEKANKHGPGQIRRRTPQPLNHQSLSITPEHISRPLSEIFKELKSRSAA